VLQEKKDGWPNGCVTASFLDYRTTFAALSALPKSAYFSESSDDE
jgi:hypothetical protein